MIRAVHAIIRVVQVIFRAVHAIIKVVHVIYRAVHTMVRVVRSITEQHANFDGKPSADIFFFAFRFCAREAAEAAEQAQNRNAKKKWRETILRAVHN